MKRLFFFSLFLVSVLTAPAQRNADFGLFGGISSYYGDINPSRPLYSPGPAAGIFYRYNLHARQALRLNASFGSLKGSDLDFNNSFQQARAASFSGSVAEVAAQFEFNFFPYASQGKRWNNSPYLAAGLGVSMINSGSFTLIPIIPFSAGFKINVYKSLGLELEYGFRKTFYDNFDGLTDFVDPADKGWLHNNDWYTFAGVSITWKLYNRLAGCPAYEDVDAKRR